MRRFIGLTGLMLVASAFSASSPDPVVTAGDGDATPDPPIPEPEPRWLTTDGREVVPEYGADAYRLFDADKLSADDVVKLEKAAAKRKRKADKARAEGR